MKASHKKKTVLVGFQNVELNPGQFVFGRRKAAATLNLSEMVVRRCLESLKTAERITIYTTNKFSIITIINWETYQSEDTANNQQNNQQPTTQTTNNEPTTSQQRATNKNDKECKKNDKEPPIPPKGVYTESFEMWWSHYPSKKNKKAAFKRWQAIGKRGEATVAELVGAIKKQVMNKHFRGNDGVDYIPGPDVWLNKGKWEDEVTPVCDNKQPCYNLDPKTRFVDDE